MSLPPSCRTPFPGRAYLIEFPAESRAHPARGVHPSGHLPNMLGSYVQFAGDAAEESVKSGCLCQLGRDTFKVVGQVEPLEYANDHILKRISESRKIFVHEKKEPGSGLGERIARLRAALGCNQVQFAQRLGTDQGTVSKWERDKQAPSPQILVSMAAMAEGVEKLVFLEEAHLPAEFLDGRPMLPELRDASTAVVAKVLRKAPIQLKPAAHRVCDWDPELLVFVIETADAKLKQMNRKLPSRKYARMIVIFYEFCHETGRRDAAIVEEFFKTA